MKSERENLMHMFNSSTWKMSRWASSTKGKAVSDLVKNPYFWASVGDVLKATNPLIGVLHQVNASDTAPMGFLYDSMDRAKEDMKRTFGDEEARYGPFWIIVDDIWNNYLHIPLHSTVYHLNPSLYHSKDLHIDGEVANGLLSCAVHMIEDPSQLKLTSGQLGAHMLSLGGFGEVNAKYQRSQIPPADWWSLHRGDCPELQKLTIKILSQTCSTSPRYKLKKHMSKQLHTKGRNCIEQQKLSDMEFVQNNLQVWHQNGDYEPEDSNLVDDWIVER